MATKTPKPPVESIEDYARRLAATWPPLTPEQVAELRVIFSGRRRPTVSA